MSLRNIGREDIVKNCIHAISVVDDQERGLAESSINGETTMQSSSITSQDLTESMESG